MTDLLGQTIGQYQLLEIIHQGENTIYKGFQPSMNRYVAVKVLNPARASNQAFVQQFHRDMQLHVGLEHPNVLPVYDFGQQDDLLYIVSRYVEGGTLQSRIPPFYSPQQAEQTVSGIAAGLDFMHGRGVIHGNLKPANVLLDQTGQPLLSDFGYTEGIDVGGQENAYLSPEQMQGVQADRRIDTYALGGVLYHMLIGEPPPIGVVPNPRLKRPDLPTGVEAIILKAMAQQPEQRFQTAGELSEALRRALTPQAPAAVRPAAQPVPSAAPPASQAQPRTGANWISLLIGGLIICLLASICAAVFSIGVASDGDVENIPGINLILPIFVGGDKEPTATPPGEQPGPEPTATPPEQPEPPQPTEEPPAPEEPPAEQLPEESGGG